MPLKKDDLDRRGDLPTGEWRETDDVPVGDMVYRLAESIANAQTKLDLNAAEVAKTLDDTEVEVVPRIVQRVHDDGSVTTERDNPVKRTLLELGFTPSRYHFSEAVIEVDFDTKMSEETETNTESNVGMRAGTSEARQHRKYNRSVETNTHVKAKLEPMVPPKGLTPEQTTLPAEPAEPEGPTGDAGEGDRGESDTGAAEEAGDTGAAEEAGNAGAAEEARDAGNDASAGGDGGETDGGGSASESASAAAPTDRPARDGGTARQGGAAAPQADDRPPGPVGTADERASGTQG